MALAYQCPKCGGVLKIEAALAGRVLQCGRCGQKIEASNPLKAVAAPPARPPVEILPVPSPRPISADEREFRAERRREAKVARHGDFLFRFMMVIVGLLVVGLVAGIAIFVGQALAAIPDK